LLRFEVGLHLRRMAGARTEKPDARSKSSGRTGSRTVPAALLLRMKHPTGALTQARSCCGIRDRPSPRGGYRLPPALASVLPPNPAAIPTRLESPMRNPTPADAELLMRLYEIRRDPALPRARHCF